MRFNKAKKLCGLASEFEITSEETYRFALAVWKEKTVDARRAENDAQAADLSQCKETFKRRYTNRISTKCPTCGGSKSQHANQCQSCNVRTRFYPNQINPSSVKMKEYELEMGTVLVPPRRTARGALTLIMTKLAEGQVGDSFVSGKPPSTVNNSAKNLGVEVIVRRANPEEKNPKLQLWRVWRSDGLDMDGVNEIIRKRMAGEAVPPPKKCVPVPWEELQAKKHPKPNAGPGRPPTKSQGPITSGSRQSS